MSNIMKFEDGDFTLDVDGSNDTVWLNRNQISELFDRDIKTIGKHINNLFKEEELEKKSVVAKFATTGKDGKTYDVEHYNLDVIISVGYRVKSKRGVLFRKWSNSVLKKYLLNGYVVNYKNLNDSKISSLISYLEKYKDTGLLDSTSGTDILKILAMYNNGIQMLDDYDHNCLEIPVGTATCVEIDYNSCLKIINMGYFCICQLQQPLYSLQ